MSDPLLEPKIPYEDRIERPQGETNRKFVDPLPESFGRSLDTLEKARQWLTNPHNWHESTLFIIRWNGLIPTVSRKHGMRLQREWWDDGLPWCVVTEQRSRRSRKDQGIPLEESDQASTATTVDSSEA